LNIIHVIKWIFAKTCQASVIFEMPVINTKYVDSCMWNFDIPV